MHAEPFDGVVVHGLVAVFGVESDLEGSTFDVVDEPPRDDLRLVVKAGRPVVLLRVMVEPHLDAPSVRSESECADLLGHQRARQLSDLFEQWQFHLQTLPLGERRTHAGPVREFVHEFVSVW